ncbi:peptidase inhibitor family I36 protein [Amycolatopsis sp. NPDC021455]|uniref:peptidase inhibitor family I36 protein n=1 Tax=Amycolatopsis sp. NPDC021455 TaxID=3154901 RepID=UPI0033F20693
MKRTLSVLFIVAAALMSLLGTASAAPAVPAPASALALSCPSGDLCVWPVSDGSSSRCSWSNADNDWQAGSVRCSWSSSRAVMVAYNHGTSSSYDRVCLYTGANYTGSAYYIRQGVQTGPAFPGVKIRSHKWVAGAGGTTC